MNNWSDLAGDGAGGDGGGVGRWPMEGGQGGRWGGAPESSVGATKGALVLFLGSLKNLTRGEMGGGAPESSVGVWAR